MSLFSFFKKNKYGGYVSALKLEKFWDSLSAEERECLKDSFTKYKTIKESDFVSDMVDGLDYKFKKVEMSGAQFLYIVGTKAFSMKKYDVAEKTLTEATKETKDSVLKHTILNELIDLYYKQREDRLDAIDKCKNYCKQSIELFPKVKKEEEKMADSESFKRLAIIFEREEKYKEAIKISELAIMHGLSDGTKGGFEGRIDKLMKKLS